MAALLQVETVKPSQVIFGLVGVLSLAFGILYILWSIAPYHEDMIGMNYGELSSAHPEISSLMATLVDVVGMLFLGLGIYLIHVGSYAWRETKPWAVLFLVFLFTLVPLTWVVYAAGGPWKIMALVDCLMMAGLVLSGFGR